jgi:hypothetical protein
MLIIKRPVGTVAYMGGVPCNLEEFTWSWGNMIAYSYEYLVKPELSECLHLDRSVTSYHSSARNTLARGFLGEWLWTTDLDHSFEPDILVRMVGLMKKHDIDVLSGLYRYKIPPYMPVVFHWSKETHGYQTIVELDWNAMIQKVSCVGAGCLLVRRKIFDRIREELKEEPFDIIHPLSEDFSFFTRLRKLEIPVFVSPAVESHHLRIHGVVNSDYERDFVKTMPLPDGGEIAIIGDK